MGIGTWVLGAVAALFAARLIRAGRPSRWWVEALVALLVAAAAGLAATALDFGGWREPDWRAATFAFLTAFAAIGLVRVARLVWL